MTRRTELALLAAVVVLTLVRVAATHHVFSAVLDEPVHIAAGYDWIVKHSNAFDPVHPPLARAICALRLNTNAHPKVFVIEDFIAVEKTALHEPVSRRIHVGHRGEPHARDLAYP